MPAGIRTTAVFSSATQRNGGRLPTRNLFASFDSDAATYIKAVEAADEARLEQPIRDAINAFVVGCKADGVWTLIDSACILSGARTLSGALVPLIGSAPTNNNFISGDYSRKDGLTGNASNKYLATGLTASSLSNTSHHLFFSGSGIEVGRSGVSARSLGGVYNGSSLATLLDVVACNNNSNIRETRSGTAGNSAGNSATITVGQTTSGTISGSRTAADSLRLFQNGASVASATNSNTPSLPALAFFVFARNNNGTPAEHTSMTINFFSIGDGLSEAQTLSLHNRVRAMTGSFIGSAS